MSFSDIFSGTWRHRRYLSSPADLSESNSTDGQAAERATQTPLNFNKWQLKAKPVSRLAYMDGESPKDVGMFLKIIYFTPRREKVTA